MEQTINERFIKLSSRIPIERDLKLGEDYVISIDGLMFRANCVKTETFDKQDGTVDMVYVLKSTLE